jgi:hypothetical protein
MNKHCVPPRSRRLPDLSGQLNTHHSTLNILFQAMSYAPSLSLDKYTAMVRATMESA